MLQVGYISRNISGAACPNTLPLVTMITGEIDQKSFWSFSFPSSQPSPLARRGNFRMKIRYRTQVEAPRIKKAPKG
jgi:hypothetical protein